MIITLCISEMIKKMRHMLILFLVPATNLNHSRDFSANFHKLTILYALIKFKRLFLNSGSID